MKTSRRCANCRHRWDLHGAACCGKEGVQQRSIADARAETGDCGPDGKFWLEDREE